MSEAGYVELPILQWLSGQDSPKPNDTGLGWTYRDEEAMAAFDRPLEDPLVEKLLVEAIIRVNPEVMTEPQTKMAVNALCQISDKTVIANVVLDYTAQRVEIFTRQEGWSVKPMPIPAVWDRRVWRPFGESFRPAS